MIDIAYLKQLLEIFDSSSVNDLRIEQEGVEIRLSKAPRRDESQTVYHHPYYQPMPQMPSAPAPQPTMPQNGGGGATADAQQQAPASSPAQESETGRKYHEIRSPIVGTFYRASSPDAPSYVEVGSQVTPGMVLCIVEAMKLMNEIECDVYGKVAKILVENAQPVEYNQLLFLIEQE